MASLTGHTKPSGERRACPTWSGISRTRPYCLGSAGPKGFLGQTFPTPAREKQSTPPDVSLPAPQNPHSHVAARAGFDGVPGWKAALHDLVEARVPDVLGQLQRHSPLRALGHEAPSPHTPQPAEPGSGPLRNRAIKRFAFHKDGQPQTPEGPIKLERRGSVPARDRPPAAPWMESRRGGLGLTHAPRTALPFALGPESQGSGSHPSATNWLGGCSQAGSRLATCPALQAPRPAVRAQGGQGPGEPQEGRGGGAGHSEEHPSHGSAGTQSRPDRQTQVGGRQRAGITPRGLDLLPHPRPVFLKTPEEKGELKTTLRQTLKTSAGLHSAGPVRFLCSSKRWPNSWLPREHTDRGSGGRHRDLDPGSEVVSSAQDGATVFQPFVSPPWLATASREGQ